MTRTSALARVVVVLALSTASTVPPTFASIEGAHPDFNGDGFADIAAAAPNDAVGAQTEAGSVTVLYGGSSGPTSLGSQLWTQDVKGVPGTSEQDDSLGWAVAWGDFDGDRYDDMAMSALESVAGVGSAGSVTVLYGTAGGLSAARAQVWNRSTRGVIGDPVEYEMFGMELATGDVDGDGFHDLLVGAPWASDLAGAIDVLYGSPAGVTADGTQQWTTSSPGIAGSEGAETYFGRVINTGDFNGDGYDDIATGSPEADEAGDLDSGAVWTIYGSATGTTSAGSQLLTEATLGVVGDPGEEELFGNSLATADFDGDGFEDLAVTIPYDDVGAVVKAGAVLVLSGSPTGLDPASSEVWHQDRFLVPDLAEVLDQAKSAATGDFDGDGFADLAVGYPTEVVGGVSGGAVIVLYGSDTGLKGFRSQFWSQASTGIASDPAFGDAFGHGVRGLDTNGDGFDDLVASAPLEDMVATDDGLLHVLLGTSRGLSSAGSQIWSHASVGVAGTADSDDWFGIRLARP